MIPVSKNDSGNPETIKVYRELLELCDFLILSSSPDERVEAGKAVLTRIENSKETLGPSAAKVEDALEVLESAAKEATASKDLSIQFKENILKARELIEHALHAEEIVGDFTFGDTLKQIESLCMMIQENGPSVEGAKNFENANEMMSLIASYRKDPEASVAGQISLLLEKMESEPKYEKPFKQLYTGRPASQFKRIWGQLMREGVDVMHPHKVWVAICDWLRTNGEPEEKMPSKAQIEKLYKEWTR